MVATPPAKERSGRVLLPTGKDQVGHTSSILFPPPVPVEKSEKVPPPLYIRPGDPHLLVTSGDDHWESIQICSSGTPSPGATSCGDH